MAKKNYGMGNKKSSKKENSSGMIKSSGFSGLPSEVIMKPWPQIEYLDMNANMGSLSESDKETKANLEKLKKQLNTERY